MQHGMLKASLLHAQCNTCLLCVSYDLILYETINKLCLALFWTDNARALGDNGVFANLPGSTHA